jgi:hypothetical protein
MRMGGLSVKSTAVKAPVLPPAALSCSTVTTETLAEIAVLFPWGASTTSGVEGGACHAGGDQGCSTRPGPGDFAHSSEPPDICGGRATVNSHSLRNGSSENLRQLHSLGDSDA